MTKKNDQTPDYYKGSRTPEHATPPEFFEMLDRKFNFTLDPCATDQNAKCDHYFTKDDDGLSRSWKDHSVFMNPPYGRAIVDWVKKAYEESRDQNTVVVGLLPAKTDTRWFHDWVYNKSIIQLWKGRLKFSGTENSAPFGSMIVIWGLDFVDQNSK